MKRGAPPIWPNADRDGRPSTERIRKSRPPAMPPKLRGQPHEQSTNSRHWLFAALKLAIVVKNPREEINPLTAEVNCRAIQMYDFARNSGIKLFGRAFFTPRDICFQNNSRPNNMFLLQLNSCIFFCQPKTRRRKRHIACGGFFKVTVPLPLHSARSLRGGVVY